MSNVTVLGVVIVNKLFTILAVHELHTAIPHNVHYSTG